MKIYTRTGDAGETRLLFGGRVSKADPRCEAYGEADFAVSAMGLARALATEPRVKEILLKAQREMFTVESELATEVESYDHFKANFRAITADHVAQLEKLIDELNAEVELPPKFIIPGASPVSSALDMARCALRTAERRMVALKERNMLANPETLRYVNRLSDLLFILARYVDRDLSFDIVTGTRI
jgi:cob(I)alamin adenosyltransferase